MASVTLPLTDASLHLAPQLSNASLTVNFLIFGLGFGLLMMLAGVLYRYELRLIAPSSARMLLGLRCLGLAILWAIIWLKPVVQRPSSETLPSQVVIALDRSSSMQTVDPQRTPKEKLQLLLRYQFAADLVDNATLTKWIDACYDDAAPGFRLASGSEDWESKKRYDAVIARADSITRAMISQKLLVPEDKPGLLEGIATKQTMSVEGFAQESTPLPNESTPLRAALAQPIPMAEGSDLRAPLAKTLERNAPGQNPVVGVVLLSDGQHNWGPSPLAQVPELLQRNIPIYPVVVGPRKAPSDIAISQVVGPTAVFQATDATIDTSVLVTNMPAGKITVTLTGETASGEKREPLTETIDHDGTNRSYPVRFRPRMEAAGTETLTVTAKPEGELKDDHPTNNSRQMRVSIAPEKAKVLIVDGEARWEYHYLAGALQRDPTMDIRSVVYHQPRLNKIPEADLESLNYPALKLPADPDALASYDCIILGDTPPEDLPLADRMRLEKYVAESGGTLVILAGKRAMPMEYLKPLPNGDLDPIARLLPIQSAEMFAPRTGFPVSMTAEGKRTAFLQMEPDPGQSLERWAKLPKQFWGVIGRAKDGAVSLGYVEGPAGDAPLPAGSINQQERDRSLMVRQNFGFGRVLFVGLESTWRWRFKVGDKYHHQFWGQVIRWAASDKPLTAGDRNVRFGSREPVVRADQPVEVLARLSDRIRKPNDGALLGMRLLKIDQEGQPGKAIGVIPIEPQTGRPRELAGVMRDLAPGDYALELVVPELAEQLDRLAGPEGSPTKMQAKFRVLPPETAESAELSTNWPLMEKLAQDSGGKLFTPETADELIELLQTKTASREITSEHRLWNSWWTLILVLVLVSGEWLLRKSVGLP
ncbi:Uncharacterized protein OS=Singulisphaera acidiphila (strain ATCC BAA-1392 / DSM 18658 / VKM B-2454 / MOB10) GN=Sinac_7527 PE=4 SV=1: VWA_2 [Tuwongella immobilis]|uniref:VWFA domain-containing protein n=2 Tax=Tuwongella immobilis TaxID=692036 RepID=A0A6C2YTD0_9BACT|nr:Uncharacterized protein OS=Singulisphaera acidiphila (strain ATCC BAA-1392 / DSM 18658 / VKM B-2454 / MOB10) GN=Sinac_7527 PE=4 SV=1: VWA_2 [Tuwongella immobilis]VTS05649.1 Uncharacterized protein OS=Singulisphaera acidiphila (strain ATCC BAA-1392 / DSM 18658 / VKM B-2454 / MOB10) GN=Sinac_7527 PE=4 SV=1: VWA_2 [Tuwongella immobilis]